MLYTLNPYRAVCQLHLTKIGEKKNLRKKPQNVKKKLKNANNTV